MTTVTNPRRRLAPRTSPTQCAHSSQNSLKSTLHAYPNAAHSRQLMKLLNPFRQHRRKTPPQNRASNQ